jgi:hypothetical protein
MAAALSETDWAAVSGRAQAYLCLHLSGLADAPMIERAAFLMRLGLPRADAAAILGTSDDSLRVQFATAAKKKAPKKVSDA